MNIGRNSFFIKLVKTLPNKPIFCASFLQKKFQSKLNGLLTNSIEKFNYVGFKLALYLGANPNIDAQTQLGYPLVTRVARSGEALFLDTLLNFGGNVHANLPKGGYFPIHMAATKGMELSIETLFKHGADINAVYELEGIKPLNDNPLGWSPLICACINNKTLAGQKLLELGANPFDTNEKGVSALDICLKVKNKELANSILEKQKNSVFI